MTPEWTDSFEGILAMIAITSLAVIAAIGSLIRIWRDRRPH